MVSIFFFPHKSRFIFEVLLLIKRNKLLGLCHRGRPFIFPWQILNTYPRFFVRPAEAWRWKKNVSVFFFQWFMFFEPWHRNALQDSSNFLARNQWRTRSHQGQHLKTGVFFRTTVAVVHFASYREWWPLMEMSESRMQVNSFQSFFIQLRCVRFEIFKNKNPVKEESHTMLD